jgi:hypothetical protein
MPNDAHGADRRLGAVRSRAARLLRALRRREPAALDALTPLLGVSLPGLHDYLEGKSRMPLDAQRRLATFVLNQVPELAREARRLQLQCAAAERFHAGETRTHMIAPAGRFR